MGKLRAAVVGISTAVAIAAPFVLDHEGWIPKGYVDPVGIPTACAGHTGIGVIVGRYYTEEQCKAWLYGDLRDAERTVNEKVKVPLSDKTKASLISFVFNIGRGNFSSSTLLKLLNRGEYVAACNELPKWVYAKGKKLPGLVTRRNAERELCLAGLQ